MLELDGPEWQVITSDIITVTRSRITTLDHGMLPAEY